MAGAAASAIAARGQQPAVPVVGMLSGQSADGYSHLAEAVRLGLKDEGFVDGQNVRMEYRWAAGRDEQLPAMAVELVNRLLLTGGSIWSTISAKAATATIPIVFSTASDPVKLGFVASLNRPGGNVTGVSFLGAQLVEKRLELATQLVPKEVAIGFIGRPRERDTRQTGKLSRVPPLHSEEKYCFSILQTSANWDRRSQLRSANMLAS
jgi:ABC-type uncharacterized transport system substrate-binding protein